MPECAERKLVRPVLWVIALLLAGSSHAEPRLIGSYVWEVDHPRFGGFSGVVVTDAGREFIAVSDRGAFATGTITRKEGIITNIALGVLYPFYRGNRAPLPPDESDSEGLAIAEDGTLFVSFEWTHGVRSFAGIDQPASALITTPAFDDMQTNSSLEALAIGPDGALYTLPERSGLATKPFPVFRYKDGVWDQPFEIARRGPYLMSGADIGPDGMLYVLERDFFGIGFRSRVRRFGLDGTGEELILETGVLTHDNLEGISVWEDDAGLVMTLISDDNFRAFQRTEFVEYRLTD